MIGRLILAFGAGFFFCQHVDAQRAVPLDKERHHKVVLENGYIRVLDGRVALGDTTPLHIHAANSVVVFLSKSSFGIQVAGKPPVITPVDRGDMRYSDYGDHPVTHVVWGQDGEAFHFYVVELGKQPHSRDSCSVLTQPGLSLQWRKPMVTAYYWDVAGDGQHRLAASNCAYLLIGPVAAGGPASGLARSSSGAAQPSGDSPFEFYPPGSAVSVDGHAGGAARYILLQLR